MYKKQIKKRISELTSVIQDAGSDAILLLEIALFVEEVFGIFLSDNEICEKNFGNYHTTEKFVLEKLKLDRKCVESVE